MLYYQLSDEDEGDTISVVGDGRVYECYEAVCFITRTPEWVIFDPQRTSVACRAGQSN